MITLAGGALQTDLSSVLYSNAFGRGTLAASSAAADGAAANIVGPATWDYWKPVTVPADITVTLAAAETCDMLAIAAHDLGSKGATLVLKYSVSAVSAYITLATVTPADDDALAVIFAPVSGMRWRLEITGASVPSIGVAMIGARLVIPGAVQSPYVPMNFARRVELMGGASLGGQLFDSRVKRLGLQNSMRFAPVLRSFVDASLAPFVVAYDAGLPFFWSVAPSYFANDLAYVRRAEGAGELRPAVSDGGAWCDLAFEVEGYGA